jgi:hypothetical protein
MQLPSSMSCIRVYEKHAFFKNTGIHVISICTGRSIHGSPCGGGVFKINNVVLYPWIYMIFFGLIMLVNVDECRSSRVNCNRNFLPKKNF